MDLKSMFKKIVVSFISIFLLLTSTVRIIKADEDVIVSYKIIGDIIYDQEVTDLDEVLLPSSIEVTRSKVIEDENADEGYREETYTETIDMTWEMIDNGDDTYTFIDSLPSGYEDIVIDDITVKLIKEELKDTEVVPTPSTSEEPIPEETEPIVISKVLDFVSSHFEDATNIDSTIMAMSDDEVLSFISIYESLLQSLDTSSLTDEENSLLEGIAGAVHDRLYHNEKTAPIVLATLEDAPIQNGAYKLENGQEIKNQNITIYHSFSEITDEQALNDLNEKPVFFAESDDYDTNSILVQIGPGAILQSDEQGNEYGNSAERYIEDEYHNYLTDIKSKGLNRYVSVIKPGSDFDNCSTGTIFVYENHWVYYCSWGGAQDCGPYYPYTYETSTLTVDHVTAYLKDLNDIGSEESENYIVQVSFNDITITLDPSTYSIDYDEDTSRTDISIYDDEKNTLRISYQVPYLLRYFNEDIQLNDDRIMIDINNNGYTLWNEDDAIEKIGEENINDKIENGYDLVGWEDQYLNTYDFGENISKINKNYIFNANWQDIKAPELDTSITIQVKTGISNQEVLDTVKEKIQFIDNEGVDTDSIKLTIADGFGALDDYTIAQRSGVFACIDYQVADINGNITDSKENDDIPAINVTVIAEPISFGPITFDKKEMTLTTTLESPGSGEITEAGFIWGIMSNPTTSMNNGKVTIDIEDFGKIGDEIKVITDIQDGIQYHARAYAISSGITYYSNDQLFSTDMPNYGKFSITNNGDNTFTISREDTNGTAGSLKGEQTVYFRTVNGSAVVGTHFEHMYGSHTFDEGETEYTITVTELGSTNAYSSHEATAYSNADRTYSMEIYRVEGGATIENGVAQRTMAVSKEYNVNKAIFNEGITENREGPTRHGDYDDDKSGWSDDRQIGNVNEAMIVFDLSELLDSDYWRTLETSDILFNMTFDAREEADGYQFIQIAKGESIDLHYYPYNGNWHEDGGISSTGALYGVIIEHGGSGKETAYNNYTLPKGSDQQNWDETWYGQNAGSYISIPFENNSTEPIKMTVGFAAGGRDSDEWYTRNEFYHFKINDTQEPQVVGYGELALGSYNVGDTYTISIIFNEIVDSSNSDLDKVSLNTTWGEARYAGGADTNVLYFEGQVPANAGSSLNVTSIDGLEYIKDMCDEETSTPTSGSTHNYDSTVVNTSIPNITIQDDSITNGVARASIIVNDDKSFTSSIRYTWSNSETLPASGWISLSTEEIEEARADGFIVYSTDVQAPGTGIWYLHVLASHDTSGGSKHIYQTFDFGSDNSPVSVRPSLDLSVDTEEWTKGPVKITITYEGDATSLYVSNNASDWLPYEKSSNDVYDAYTNGTYTFKLTSNGEEIYRSVLIDNIDDKDPSIILSGPTADSEYKIDQNNNKIYHSLRFAVSASDLESGVSSIYYAFSETGDQNDNDLVWKEVINNTIDIDVDDEVVIDNYLHVKAIDNAGNQKIISSSAIKVLSASTMNSNVPKISVEPILYITNPSGYINDSVTLEWSLENYDNKNYRVVVITPDGKESELAQEPTNSGTFLATNNGNYIFKVTDKDYGAENTCEYEVKIDRQAPTVSLKYDPDQDGYTNEMKVMIEASDDASGISHIRYAVVQDINNTPLELIDYDDTTGITINENSGTYFVYYEVEDRTGAIITDESRTLERQGNITSGYSKEIKIDNTDPTVTLSIAGDEVEEYRRSKTIVIDVFDAHSGIASVKIEGKELEAVQTIENNTRYLYEVSENGTYVFLITDKAGNTTNDSIEVKNIDNTIPEIDISATTTDGTYISNTWTNKDVTIEAFVTNDVPSRSTIQYTSENGNDGWTDLPEGGLSIKEDTEGVTYRFRAVSGSGVTSAEKELIIKKDSIAPTGEIIFDETNIYKADDSMFSKGIVKVTVKMDDVSSGIEKAVFETLVDGNEIGSSVAENEDTFNLDLTSIDISDGSKAIEKLTLIDNAGNKTTITSDAITVDKNAPTITSVTYDNNPIKEFLNTITFGLFFKDSVEVSIKADDGNGSGVYAISYTLDGTEYTDHPDNGSGTITFNIDESYIGNVSNVHAVDHLENDSSETSYEYFSVTKAKPSVPTVEAYIVNDEGNEISYDGSWTNKDIKYVAFGSTATSKIESYEYSVDNGNTWEVMEAVEAEEASATSPKNVIKAEVIIKDDTEDIIFRSVANGKDELEDLAYSDATSSYEVNIDKDEPSILIVGSDTDNYLTYDEIGLEIKTGASGIGEVTVKKDGVTDHIEDEDGTYNYVIEENGTYTFEIKNGAGIIASKTITYTKIDNATPIIEVDATTVGGMPYTSNTWTASDVTIEVSNAANNLGETTFYYCLNDDDEWNKLTDIIKISGHTDRSIDTYSFKAKSASGVYSDVIEFIVKRDTVAPIAVITFLDDEDTHISDADAPKTVYYKDSIEILIEASDSDSVQVDDLTISYAIKDEVTDPMDIYDWLSYDKAIELDDGHGTSHILYAKVEDRAGNITYVGSDKIVFDKAGTDSSIEFIAPDATLYINEDTYYPEISNSPNWTDKSVTIKIDGSDDALSGIDYYEYSLDGGVSWQIVDADEDDRAEITISETSNDESGTNIVIRAISNVDAISQEKEVAVYIDKETPEINITATTIEGTYQSDTWTNKDVTVALSNDMNKGKTRFYYREIGQSDDKWILMDGDKLEIKGATVAEGEIITYEFKAQSASGIESLEPYPIFTIKRDTVPETEEDIADDIEDEITKIIDEIKQEEDIEEPEEPVPGKPQENDISDLAIKTLPSDDLIETIDIFEDSLFMNSGIIVSFAGINMDDEVIEKLYDELKTQDDSANSIVKIEIVSSDKHLSSVHIKNISDTDWTEIYSADSETETSKFTIEAVDEMMIIHYFKVTDVVGNVYYFSTEMVIFDTIAPKISGITNGGRYTNKRSITISDKNLYSYVIDGVEYIYQSEGATQDERSSSMIASLDAEEKINELESVTLDLTYGRHTITVYDKASNVTTYTVNITKLSIDTDHDEEDLLDLNGDGVISCNEMFKTNGLYWDPKTQSCIRFMVDTSTK